MSDDPLKTVTTGPREIVVVISADGRTMTYLDAACYHAERAEQAEHRLHRVIDGMQPANDVGAVDVIDVPAVAKLLGCDRNTLYDMIKRGEGPPHRRIGQKIVLERQAVIDWLKTGDESKRRKR